MNNNSITLLKSKIEDLLEGYWQPDIWKIEDFPYQERLGNTKDRKVFNFYFGIIFQR